MKDWQKDKTLACFPGVPDSNPRRRPKIGLQCLHRKVDVVFKRGHDIGAENDFDPPVFSLKNPNPRKTSNFTGYFPMCLVSSPLTVRVDLAQSSPFSFNGGRT